MFSVLISKDGVIKVRQGQSVVFFQEDEKELMIQVLEMLEPTTKEQFDEITIMLNILRKIPNLKLVN